MAEFQTLEEELNPKFWRLSNPSPMTESETLEEEEELNPQFWRVCAGTTAWIPAAGASVYYFPQGHAEHCSSPPDFSSVPDRSWTTLCRVANVSLLADPETDEVFARIVLDPLDAGSPPPPPQPPSPFLDSPNVWFYAKVLTPTDAPNFSVPFMCEQNNFPTIYPGESRVISVKDVHGTTWWFLFTCHGIPEDPRMYLCGEWSKFAKTKKLVAGDTVVFFCNQDMNNFVGIRRASRVCGSSSGLGVTLESVVEAVRCAAMKQRFEVEYYPVTGSQVFVVGAEFVEAAAKVSWKIGMRIKVSTVTVLEYLSRMTEFSGTVIGMAPPDPDWPDSQWRILQVTWDKPESFRNVNCVNPWQVSTFERSNCILINKHFALTWLNTRMAGNSVQSFFENNIFPLGRQGARRSFSFQLFGRTIETYQPSLCDVDRAQ